MYLCNPIRPEEERVVRKYLLLAPFLVSLAVAAVLVACGSGGEEDDSPAAAAQPTSPPAAAVTNITVKAGDWYFEPNVYTAKVGTVKVTFNSVGPMFPHTFGQEPQRRG
jgi:hypothetical protein